MGVVAEVAEQLVRAGEGGLAVDDPGLCPERGAQFGKGGLVRQGRDGSERGWEDESAGGEEFAQPVEELAAKDLAQSADGEQEAGMGRPPTLTIERQGAAGDDAVQVEVGAQLLVPGVQHQSDTEEAAKVVAAER